jgi:hypothetical protein
VPSLTPRATQKLWTRLVHNPPRYSRSALGDCRPLKAVFYTSTDWLRLATKLAATPSPCAEYYISIPPLAADKTAFRYDQPWRIRALGPQFHPVAEINVTGWTNWVTTTGQSWYDAGLEARRKMAAADFRVELGDGWALNELSSAVRRGDGNARANMREFLRGLYSGDGAVPQAKGTVYITGMAQSTADLSTYKARLQDWYADAPFWSDMSAYVSDWSQELYGDVRNYAVAGAAIDARRDYLNEYFQHELALADVGPETVAAAHSFLHATYSPLANAAWQWDASFGWTNVPVAQMQDYVSAQTSALRAYAAATAQPTDHFGFAWAPKNLTALPLADFNAQTGALLDRLALALRDSGESAGAACGLPTEPQWCVAELAGASFTEAWKTFATWAPATLGFASAPQTITAGDASGPISVQLQTGTVADASTSPETVTLVSSSATGTFSTATTGPWTATLEVTIPAGSTAATVYYRDTTAGTATLTASATGRTGAAQAITVQAAAAANVSVSPASATVVFRGTETFTATATDAYGNSVAAAPTWSLSSATLGTLAVNGATATFTAGTTAGSGTITAAVGGVSASASLSVVAPKAHVSSIAYRLDVYGRLLVTVTVVDGGTGTPLAGANVSLVLYRNSVAFASGSGVTGSAGTLTLRTSSTPAGCYRTTIRSVSLSGYAWDGTTPANGYCR